MDGGRDEDRRRYHPPMPSPEPARADARLAQLERMVAADPGDVFCLYALAQEWAKRGVTEQALAWYDRCLAADPDHCYAYFHKARVLEDAGRVDEAIAALTTGLGRARAVGDGHAASEIAGYLDQLS
jgi:tetratricopeptide (TPR) repeat protein